MSGQYSGPGHPSDAESYVREWAHKTGRRPEDVYVPEALRDVSAQVARHAEPINMGPDELEGQMSLFDDWPLEEPPDPALEDLYEELSGEPMDVASLGSEPERADFRAAYIVVIDHSGETLVCHDLDQSFSVERSATADEVRRSSRDVYEHAHAQYVASWVTAKPPVNNSLREAAKRRGLVS